MAAKGKLERRRERILALIEADPQRSARSIAATVGCSPNTVLRARRLHMQVNGPDCTLNDSASAAHPGMANLIAPAEPGNDRAVTHGAYSAARLEPRVQALTGELRTVVPGYQPADDAVITMLALLLAQLEQVNAWLADHGLFKNVARGELQPVLAAQGKWINTASRLCDQLALTPTARARLGVVAASDDGYARYLEITNGKATR